MNSCERSSSEVHRICKLNVEIYKCVTPDIKTDDVIITEERIAHIQKEHPNDYERFHQYIPQVIEDPDYIIQDTRPNTAVVLKEVAEAGERFRLSLRLTTVSDAPEYKNSILTFMKIREKEWQRLLRNKTLLYKNSYTC